MKPHRPTPTRLAPASAGHGAFADVAREIVEGVLDSALAGAPADRELARRLRAGRAVTPEEARFVSRLAFAVFRWWGWTRPLREESLPRLLFFSYWLDGGPAHPALEAWRPREGVEPLAAEAGLAARARAFTRATGKPADPGDLVPTWFRDMVDGPAGPLVESFQGQAPLWIRARAADAAPLVDELHAAGVEAEPHATLAGAIRVRSDVSLYELPAFRAGRFEVQDLASQAVGAVCAPRPRERWWDACAGFGGKTLLLASLLAGKGTVVATDVRAHKLDETRRRARRAGLFNISARAWEGKGVPAKAASFDGVLVDAPCSGTGTWRRNPDARWSTSPDDVSELAGIQARLLRTCAAGVKPGGVLVYAVCALTRPETTWVLEAFLLERAGEFVPEPVPHPLTGEPTDGRVWIRPERCDGDGMFIARLRRASGPRGARP